MTADPLTLWTIGHSIKPTEEFVGLLNVHGIRQLIDVRTVPKSRYNPHFNADVLAQSLAAAGIGYRHAVALGGLRKPRKNSTNAGWRNESFRGYADYMQSEEFWKALDALTAESRDLRTAIMCAEAVPWRCHRSLIADALLIRGWDVRHIMSRTKADAHRLTSFAKVDREHITYPTPSDEQTPCLFE